VSVDTLKAFALNAESRRFRRCPPAAACNSPRLGPCVPRVPHACDPAPQPVTALAFSDGGDVLLSGGEDTLVHAWLLLDLLDASGGPDALQGAAPASFQSW